MEGTLRGPLVRSYRSIAMKKDGSPALGSMMMIHASVETI